MKKNIIYMAFVLIAFAACKKNNETSTTPLNDTIPPDTAAAVRGTFINGPYGTVNGTAKLYLQNGKYILALENVTISNGPDLHVYLSKEMQPVVSCMILPVSLIF